MNEQFKKDVEEGLSSNPKKLSSKYFYDKTGDALFVEIMNMPEYYLSNAEYDIFKNQTNPLIDAFGLSKTNHFELIELGAGDGRKTIELLRGLKASNYSFDYFPIDISHNALDGLKDMLSNNLPDLNVHTKQGDYFDVLSGLKDSNNPKIVLFLGSNIGNLSDDLAAKFIYNLGANLKPKDKLLIGVDLIKAREIVLPAYNDESGITSSFNLNLLQRINAELGGNFNISEFEHSPEYEEQEGVARSFLKSKIDKDVEISSIGKSYSFKKDELIHTEISRKYNDEILKRIIRDTDFSLKVKLTDSNGYFADYILERG